MKSHAVWWRNPYGVRTHTADAVRRQLAPGERVSDGQADGNCCDDYGVQILEFDLFRTQILIFVITIMENIEDEICLK